MYDKETTCVYVLSSNPIGISFGNRKVNLGIKVNLEQNANPKGEVKHEHAVQPRMVTSFTRDIRVFHKGARATLRRTAIDPTHCTNVVVLIILQKGNARAQGKKENSRMHKRFQSAQLFYRRAVTGHEVEETSHDCVIKRPGNDCL